MTPAPHSIERVRGEPLVVLAAVLGGWLVLRVLLWQSPFADQMPPQLFAAAHDRVPAVHAAPLRLARPAAPGPVVPGPREAPNAAPLPPPWLPTTALDEHAGVPQPLPAAPSVQRIVGQQLLLAAAFSHIELPTEIAGYVSAARSPGRPAPALAGNGALAGRPPLAPAGLARWSGDGWLLLRKDSAGPLVAGEPSYGRSQAGAVLRYRLAPSSGHRPVAYARVTRALAGPRETEAAVGLAARPLAGVPLSVAGEVRAYDGPAGRELRPAAFAVTELAPARLPLGLIAEAYVQAGYVGGRFATAFVDGQARLDARVARLGRDSEVRAGGGAWGGAQKHAARLDIGPSATVSFRLGETRSRIALDYRWRVAGDAEPRSGPALTISAGF